MKNIIKGYKVFNPDWSCRDFQYKVGETYEHNGDIELCVSGFHFCLKAIDCFNYYMFDSDNRVAEVEAIGLVKTGDDKSVTNKIRIVRELDWIEVLELVNTGKECTGYGNSGNRNSGNNNSGGCNSGNRNSGDKNSGVYNSGDFNSGDGNSGDNNFGNRNSGHGNSGHGNSGHKNYGYCNSGYCNLGNYNSGDWNSGNGNNGVFCTEEPKIKIFDIQSDMTLSEWRDTEAAQILSWYFETNVWVSSEDMTEEEKKMYQSYKTTGGYLKTLSFKEACINMWNNLTNTEKDMIQSIPNFNKDKFREITGIEIL